MVVIQGWKERALALFRRHRWLPTVLAFVPIAVLSLAVLLFRHRIEDLSGLGLAGVFTVNLLGSGTFVLPVPGVLATFVAGKFYPPLLVGLASAAGSTLGELTGFVAGMGAEPAIERIPLLRQVERWMQDRGGLVIFLFALIPNPFFDFIGFAAGSMDYPVRRFLVFCALGKAVKFLAIAYAGYYGIDVAIRYFSST